MVNNSIFIVSIYTFSAVGVILSDTNSNVSVTNTNFTYIISKGNGYNGYVA